MARGVEVSADALVRSHSDSGPASFADEEVLAATIAREYDHVLQQRAGEHLRRPLAALEDEA
ncbi:hypothetical protein AB0J86_23235 [Micromonospora sp. NPDC049559]|uniref:hypothetical protein n=1 Tax=Micromonospora sp. NPDC049559 TaxID=3155923 RepID=UPI00343859BB